MIELNAAEFPKFRCPVRAPIEPRERKVVPRAIADAKLNLTRADSAFGLCSAPVCTG
jgi:hypothetical protein